jgi:hypothetical protein
MPACALVEDFQEDPIKFQARETEGLLNDTNYDYNWNAHARTCELDEIGGVVLVSLALLGL